MEEWLELFKALADEKRLKILSLLYRHGFCVGALARILNVSDAVVSSHIRILRNAGLLKGEKRGGYTFYEVNLDVMRNLPGLINTFLENNSERKECCQFMTGEHQYCEIYIHNKEKTRHKNILDGGKNEA